MEQFESVKSMIESLHSEDPEGRLSSMRGIHLIAATLGPERTRDELLPYLTDYLDDNDEVLRVFANALGTMIHEVGGVAHTKSLLAPLEVLCSLDEVTVRDEAIASLQLIGGTVFGTNTPAGKDAQAEYVALLQRLREGSPQCRSCVCYLLSVPYTAAAASVRSTLVSQFQQLCSDPEIMVRRAACVAMGKTFAKAMGAKASAELLPALTAFSKDSSDGVRLQAVTACAALLEVLPEVQHPSVLTALRSLSSDNSWRVRYMTADSLGKLAAALSPPDVLKYAVPIFRSLCQDAEPEIRASTVFNMASVLASCRDAGGKKELLLAGTRLVTDDSSHVRMSLASAVLKSVAHVPQDLWSSNIIPACTQLLGDADASVRLALVSGFSSMGNTAEAREMAPKLVPIVVALAADPKWRLRDTVITQVPYIITSLGRAGDDILDVCVEHLGDGVATIREAAVQSCCKLVAENGAAWAAQALFPRVAPLAHHTNYLRRVSLLHLYKGLAQVAAFDATTCETQVWPQILLLQSDPVPNVRMNVARAVVALQGANKVSERDAQAVLRKLSEDSQEDVRDAAKGVAVK